MRLVLLLTGGTIGSVMQDNVLDVGGNPSDKLLRYLEQRRPTVSAEITCKYIMNILSENMQFSHWMELYRAVEEELKGEWDGILITHGTDTLSYTAAFLAMMCSDVMIPIFLISSQLSLEEPQADGYDNFVAAVDFASEVKLGGVFVPTTEEGMESGRVTSIHLGGRLTQAQGFTHRFQSVGDIYFGRMTDGHFLRNPVAYNPILQELMSPEQTMYEVLKRINDDSQICHILFLRAVPGMNLELIDWTIKPKAILIELYHSGTACTRPQDSPYSIIAFGKRCREQGIDLYGVSVDTRKSLYQSSMDMQKAGIRVLSDISTEAAYVKLCLAYRAFEKQDERDQFLDGDVAFEKLKV
jgi:L-asparaginase